MQELPEATQVVLMRSHSPRGPLTYLSPNTTDSNYYVMGQYDNTLQWAPKAGDRKIFLVDYQPKHAKKAPVMVILGNIVKKTHGLEDSNMSRGANAEAIKGKCFAFVFAARLQDETRTWFVRQLDSLGAKEIFLGVILWVSSEAYGAATTDKGKSYSTPLKHYSVFIGSVCAFVRVPVTAYHDDGADGQITYGAACAPARVRHPSEQRVTKVRLRVWNISGRRSLWKPTCSCIRMRLRSHPRTFTSALYASAEARNAIAHHGSCRCFGTTLQAPMVCQI